MTSESVAAPVPMDPSRCPLCGKGNRCAMAGATAGPAVDCWCMTARIPQSLLQGLPADVRHRACVCAQCASSPPSFPATEPPP